MSEVDELINEKERLNKLIQLKNKVLKLKENKEFQEIILENFCEKDCAGYIRTSINTCISKKSRKNALELAKASGHLLNYLDVIITQGNVAEKQLLVLETEFEED